MEENGERIGCHYDNYEGVSQGMMSRMRGGTPRHGRSHLRTWGNPRDIAIRPDSSDEIEDYKLERS